MTADTNGGLLAPNILATQGFFDTYELKRAKVETDSVFKEGDTIDLDYVVRQIALEAHLTQHLVLTKVLKTSAIFHQFFPEGLDDINHFTRTNVPTILDRMITASTANALLFPGQTAIWVAWKSSFNLARVAQTGKMGSVSADMSAFLDAELALCMQLTDNVYDIRKMFAQNKVKAMSYFSESSLYGPTHHSHQHYTGHFEHGVSVVTFEGIFTAKTHIMVKSKTAHVNIMACVLEHSTDVCTSGQTVNGIGQHTWLASVLGSLSFHYLVLTNLSLTDGGDWEIDIID